MTQEKVASAMSLAYGDQGPLSLARGGAAAGGATAAIPVSFVADDKTFASPGVRERIRLPVRADAELDADGDGAIDYVRLGRRRRAADAQRRQGTVRGARHV